MYVYRRLRPLAALSFDLDGTLYENQRVIMKAEQQLETFIQNQHPCLSHFQLSDLNQLRQELRLREPTIYHDTTKWRWRAIYLSLRKKNINSTTATICANSAIQNFLFWRSSIDIPIETHTTLASLGDQYPMVAITNGNADLTILGLAKYFKFILKAGLDGRPKPYGDMYHLAKNLLRVEARKILHVGDDLRTDVAGAFLVGFQTCWLNNKKPCLFYKRQSPLLPDIKISRLALLTAVL